MKKKISLLLCILMASLCFVGCGKKLTEDDYDVATMQQAAEVIMSTFSAMSEEDLAQFNGLSEYELNYIMMSNGLPIAGEDFVKMIESWEAAEEECGAYVEHGEYKTKITSDGPVLLTEAKYEERKATIEFHFNKDGNLESMDVSAEFSLGEILKKAGLNTVLGMGVVFIVLILLALIIYAMKYIPSLAERFSGDGNQPFNTVQETTSIEIPQSVQPADDLELVAVITAAIAAQEGKSPEGFVVRSIRRRTSNKWNAL